MEIKPSTVAKTRKGKKLCEEDLVGRLVTQPEFLDHLNQVIFEPILGVELSRESAKHIVDGIANQIVFVALSGGSVRLGDLGTFSACVSEGANSKSPLAKDDEEPRKTARLSFRASANTKRLVKQTLIEDQEQMPCP